MTARLRHPAATTPLQVSAHSTQADIHRDARRCVQFAKSRPTQDISGDSGVPPAPSAPSRQ